MLVIVFLCHPVQIFLILYPHFGWSWFLALWWYLGAMTFILEVLIIAFALTGHTYYNCLFVLSTGFVLKLAHN